MKNFKSLMGGRLEKDVVLRKSRATANVADYKTPMSDIKIITWNCNMVFRKKAAFIMTALPDILIVPECENQERLLFDPPIIQPTDMFWYGINPNKGIGVFSYTNFKIKLVDIHNPAFKYVLPICVSNHQINLIVLAVWAQKPEQHNCYTEQVWNAVHFYSNLLANEHVIIAGDFNSNSIWDKPNRMYNHTRLVDYLKAKNIFSTYHHFHHQTQGKEKDSTFFWYRQFDKPYHIDYCFASLNLINQLKNVEIGTYTAWTKHSDHKPLTVTFDLLPQQEPPQFAATYLTV